MWNVPVILVTLAFAKMFFDGSEAGRLCPKPLAWLWGAAFLYSLVKLGLYLVVGFCATEGAC